MNLRDDRVEICFHGGFCKGAAYRRLRPTKQLSCGNKDQARACVIYRLSGSETGTNHYVLHLNTWSKGLEQYVCGMSIA